MKQTYLACLLVMLVSGCASAPETKKDETEYSPIDMKYLVGPLIGKNISYSHANLEDHVRKGYILSPGEKIGTAAPWPERLSDNHDVEIKQAIDECNKGNYKNAFNILEGLYESEQDNLFYLITFARTLYWSKEYHQNSQRVYEEIRDRLDEEISVEEHEVHIDLWFPDLYWKLATLYLDREHYEKAVFEIARTLACGYNIKSKQFEQAISYLTESYYYLGNKEYNNYLYHQTKRLFPSNRYVDSFLLH